ncbi:MAG: sulfate adenylyltransferase subunit CysN [Phycisphaerae bacterium]|nr:sulfate adenylyltransferase subunit CysN [Phycisphaerae bacterium]
MTITAEILTQRNEQADVLRFTTAGSVDDGKSTLIGRLLHDSKSIFEDHLESLGRDSRRLGRDAVDLALLTDGLKDERQQGITIDVAYRYFATPKRRFIIADTPGHEQYTRNMATGASTANLAIILIDARNGVLTQSKRHGFIASLLNIPHMVVAVNKMDLVDFSRARFEEIREEYSQFAARLGVRDVLYIPICALGGDNVVHPSPRMDWYAGPTLLSHLENVYIDADRNLVDFRFPVQYVNRPNADFRGYCGTVASGVVRPGEEVMVLPSRKVTRVKSIVTAEGRRDYAFCPQAVTITLEDEIDVSRGDMLVHPNNLPYVGSQIEAMLVWMSRTPMTPQKTYQIKHSTNLVRGQFVNLRYRVDPNELHRQPAEELGLNEIARVELNLMRPVMFDEYSRNRQTGCFIVIDPRTNGTVGAGMIINRSMKRPGAGPADAEAKPVSRNISRHTGAITAEDRARLLGAAPRTYWLTGLSGSGKSTLAYELERKFFEAGRPCYVLDGDNVRHGLNRDLGFRPEDRTENIRRVAEVARLFNEAGLTVVTAFISPYQTDRETARRIIGPERFIEVHLATPLAVCEQRDPKGLYAKARQGEIPNFSGVSAPYEEPTHPEFRFDTSVTDIDEILLHLLPPA